MILKTTDLSKSYGSIQALNGLNLEINRGDIIGILGPNGSGKTTTLALVLGVIHPTHGEYEWFEGTEDNPCKRIGTILETPNFYDYLSGWDNLKIVEKIKGREGRGLMDLAEMVGLGDRIHSKVKTYSLGMKQRLAIAAAMIGDPEVLIFDEPTNGLDPQGIAEVRNLIIEIGKLGKTIIMASHILSEVEKICTHTAILQKGKLLTSGPVNTILKETNNYLIGSDDDDKLLHCLRRADGYIGFTESEDGVLYHFEEYVKGVDINAFCFENKIVLNQLTRRKSTLEDAFINLLNENKAPSTGPQK